MPAVPTHNDLLALTIESALKFGADAADARIARSESVSIGVRDGKLETIERDETTSVALRVLFGRRQAHVSGSDISETALGDLAQRCAAMAKLAPEDPFCGLAPSTELATEMPELDLDGDAPSANEDLEADALAAEAAALAVPAVKTVPGAGAGWTRAERWVAASNGFQAYRSGGYSSVGLSAVAERDGAMERDYDSWTTRRRADRPTPVDIGRIAGERAAARLGPRKVSSRTAAVIYDKRVSSSLLSPLIAAVSGPAVARGVSFLKDRLNAQIFAPGVAVIDDPFRPMGLGSRNHDGEGRPVARTHLVENGVLTQWLLNGPSAKQLGLRPNGFAGSGFGDPPGVATSNLFLAAGEETREALMAEVGEGLLITDMFGPSINPNTGDYSVGVAGFWFEGGDVAYPVSEVTVAGNLIEMFKRLRPANDLEFRGSRNAPSVLIEGLQIAGD